MPLTQRPPAFGTAPSLDDIADLAKRAWDAIAPDFRDMAGDVIFRVEDIAEDEAMLDELEIEDPLELTGVYTGPGLNERSIMDATPATPMVILYRLAILFEWAARGDVTLDELVQHVLIHEIGHHFGLTDEAMNLLLEGQA
jgi:predicted Zn-dependent protease with MMP-like domain